MSSLSKLKIIEVAGVLAGPLVGSFFSELGAEVIKIEAPGRGDITRSWKLASEDPDAQLSSYFASANYNKTLLRLDLVNESDRNNFLQLLESADVLISNFKAGDLSKFRLSKDDIQSRFPRLIWANISGFGENDHRVAFDMVLQAESGFLAMSGTPQGELTKMPVALIDVLASHQVKEALLLALLAKKESGKGRFIELNLFDTALSSLANQASAYLMTGHSPRPMGTLHPSIAPYGEIISFQDDRKMVLAIGSDKQFKALCAVLNCEVLSEDSRFATNQSRVINRQALWTELNQASSKLNMQSCYEQLIEHQVPVGRIRTVAEVLSDPQAQSLILEDEVEGQLLRRMKTYVAKHIERPE
ncbi:MAG: CoA transferase [Bacteroidetes bacterium]|nr:MAG: CoA transferase [Bacteroidota bacterium]